MYVNMVKNVMANLRQAMVYRIDVNFQIQDRYYILLIDSNLDTLIGRTAHILFLECQPLLRMIVTLYDQFFS
jgi:hypothetical protein